MKAALRIAAVLCIGALTACGGGTPGDSGSPTPSPGESQSSVTPAPDGSPQATPPSGQPTAPVASTSPTQPCPSTGSLKDASYSEPGNLSTLNGRAMRVGQHTCYERFVFEMAGDGAEPFWRVGYREPLVADPSGQDVQLRGGADLEIVIGVWTVTAQDGVPGDQVPFLGSQEIFTNGYQALQEARVISSFEGVTQIGLGIDTKRRYEVSYLTGPPRLVVDVSTS